MDNENLKQVFKSLHFKITKEVNPDDIIDVLYSKSILTDGDYYDLRQAHGSRNRCRDLFSLLYCSSHPEAFIHLRFALLDEYRWIVDEIDEQLTSLTAQQQQRQQEHTADGKFLLAAYNYQPRMLVW